MKLAFCIFNYYPYGGLARDFSRIANLCQERGHDISVFTMHWQGALPKNLTINIVPAKGFTNHTKCKSFVENLTKILKQQNYDAVIGFNRMPGLDIYYICDVCYACTKRYSFIKRLGSRYKIYQEFENAVFAPTSKTQIIYKAETLKQQYMSYYHTPESRFHLVNPGIDPSRKIPNNAKQMRDSVRANYGIKNNEQLILLIGSNFALKGVDRALLAFASLPKSLRKKARFWIIGKGKKNTFKRFARSLSIAKQINFLGTTEKITELLVAGDLLIHPSRQDATGSVILEAIAAGLPVLSTAVCGFSSYVIKSQAGLVVPVPFKQKILNQYLLAMLDPNKLKDYKKHAVEYSKNEFIYDNADIVNKIEKLAIAAKHSKVH